MSPRATVLGAVLPVAAAAGGKLAYAQATPTELRWVLGPSCFVAERLGGLRFAWASSEGFVSHGAHMVVGPPCAGVNFLVACSLALYFSVQGAAPSLRAKLSLGAASFVAGFGATVVANGARIALAARLGDADMLARWASHAAVHRLIGVVVYAVALLAACILASRVVASPRRTRIAIPLACYVGVALALPLVHAALGRAVLPARAGVDGSGLALHVAQTLGALAVLSALAVFTDRRLDWLSSRRASPSARA